MKKLVVTSLVLGGLLFALGSAVQAQTIYPTPFFTSFADTAIASTFNGVPLVPGTIIQAYDTSGTYCGIDTVTTAGTFGYFSVYGDDPNTAGLDEGAETNEPIVFQINGRLATVVGGDNAWAHQSLKWVTLSASSTVAISAVSLPTAVAALPGDTIQFRADVRNDGDGLDFYGVNLSMSIGGSSSPFDWEALEPDTVVYAEPGATAAVYFSVRVPTFNADTVNTITFSVFSHIDPTVSVDGTVDIFMTLTDVDDPSGLMPTGFVLQQNYPNPFNPTTMIAFSLSERSNVTLDVINVLGQVVESQNLGNLGSGSHEIEFDASSMASGVYFYRLSTEDLSQTKKMLLLK